MLDLSDLHPDPVESPPPYYAVVQRGRADAFEMLSRFNSEDLVQVVWDRRVSERRRNQVSVTDERRRGERRRHLPRSWESLGFTLVPWRGDRQGPASFQPRN